MRIVFAAFMLLHGIAHVVGFLGAWAPTRTTIIGDRIDLGPSWIKIVGLGWLLLAIAFGVAAVATVLGAVVWLDLATTLGVISLLLCLLQLPDTRFGVVLNVILLAALLFGRNVWF